MSGLAIHCEGVAAGYPGHAVLRDFNLEVTPGEMLGVLGPNGAGKTTLFRVLTGLLPCREGRVTLFGAELARLRAAERARQIGVVPQSLESPMPFTVGELALMGRTSVLNRWTAPSARDREIAESALAQTDALALRERIFGELSGGEKQRALIAMALAQEPRILLLDEATAHLDIRHKLEILELVTRLNRETGVTVLMTSHDLGLTADFSRRVILLKDGRIAADGRPDDVLNGEAAREVFGCELRMHRDPETGSAAVFPVRKR
jgi:iron complex transport system ATP-binding protein